MSVTSRLWLPLGATRPEPERAGLPEGDVVRLADGRHLRRAAVWRPNQYSAGYVYAGPGGLRVIASMDDTERWGPRLHVSLSYPGHDPSWRTIRLVKAAFFGDGRDAMMVLPREADYVNIHDHCFHLWQTPEGWGMR